MDWATVLCSGAEERLHNSCSRWRMLGRTGILKKLDQRRQPCVVSIMLLLQPGTAPTPKLSSGNPTVWAKSGTSWLILVELILFRESQTRGRVCGGGWAVVGPFIVANSSSWTSSTMRASFATTLRRWH